MTQGDLDSVPVLLEKIETLTASIDRLERMMEREIKQLKDEQIGELKKQNERLADDQRRAWDAIRALELDRSQRTGSAKTLHAIMAGGGALIGAVATAIGTRFLK